MFPPVHVAGLDGRSLLLEAPVLKRDGHVIEETPSGRALMANLARAGGRLVVLGPRLSDFSLPETIRRIRSSPVTRHVSILVLVPAGEPPALDGEVVVAGANAVLRRPLDPARLESWMAKLLSVPLRVRARVPVEGHVVGTPKSSSMGHFCGLARNLSVHGMLLASPVRLTFGHDVDLELNLPGAGARLEALGRVVRDAPEVGWPYLGYGVEFLYLPPDSLDAIIALVTRSIAPVLPAGLQEDANPPIRSTLRREAWVYEILEPTRHGDVWQVEIRRAARENWLPGCGGPFYVVEGVSPEAALATAREFLVRHG